MKYSFFAQKQKKLIVATTLYVLLLIVTHSTLPAVHVWLIAMVFSIAMNFIYVVEAYTRKEYFKLEAVVAGVLIIFSVLGVVLSPIYVIAAILGHGLWDLLKHSGAGVPFFRWYLTGCFLVDTTYSTVLIVYWLQ